MLHGARSPSPDRPIELRRRVPAAAAAANGSELNRLIARRRRLLKQLQPDVLGLGALVALRLERVDLGVPLRRRPGPRLAVDQRLGLSRRRDPKPCPRGGIVFDQRPRSVASRRRSARSRRGACSDERVDRLARGRFLARFLGAIGGFLAADLDQRARAQRGDVVGSRYCEQPLIERGRPAYADPCPASHWPTRPRPCAGCSLISLSWRSTPPFRWPPRRDRLERDVQPDRVGVGGLPVAPSVVPISPKSRELVDALARFPTIFAAADMLLSSA
jgi:hypothetical protein